MKTFQLKITSPDGVLFEDEIIEFSARGNEGDLAILAGHIPFFTLIRPGICKITTKDEEEKVGEISNGMLTVSNECTTLLCGELKWNNK